MLHLTEHNFEETINQGITLVDFYADRCGPCQILGKLMPHLAKKYDWQATIAKVNTEQEFTLTQKYGVTSLPTVILFKDGQEVQRVRGLLPPEKYSEILDTRIIVS